MPLAKQVVKQIALAAVEPEDDNTAAPNRKRFLQLNYPPFLTPQEAVKYILTHKKEVAAILNCDWNLNSTNQTSD